MEEKKLDKDTNVRSKKILANRVYSDKTLKSWTKEQLIEQIRILEHNWAVAEEKFNNSVANSDKIFYEQKAKIERLTRELNDTVSMNKMYIKKVEENAELQKRVDDLGARNCGLGYLIKELKQAVKNVAKGIYKEIGGDDILVVQTQEYGEIEVVPIERLKEIIKKKGVEVE